MTTEELLRELPIDRDLVVRFFALISRFEFGLKVAGFAPQEGEAKPDWCSFATRIDAALAAKRAKSPALDEAIGYLLEHPPRKQTLRAGKLLWTSTPEQGGAPTIWILTLVRRVRNNLFHGGKYTQGSHDEGNPETARDEKLIRTATTILEECIDLEPAVAASFESTSFG